MAVAAARVAISRTPARSAAARFVQSRFRSGGKVFGEEEKAAKNVYKDPSPRLNMLFEKLDQATANEARVYNETRAVIRNGRDKLEKQLKALAYGLHALSACVLLEACITKRA